MRRPHTTSAGSSSTTLRLLTGDSGSIDFIQGVLGTTGAGPAYEESPIFNIGIEAICSAFSRAPLEWWDQNPRKDGAEEVLNAPLAKLFAAPCAGMTAREFWQISMVEYMSYGIIYWFLADSQGKPLAPAEHGGLRQTPTQIIPVRGKLVKREEDGSGLKYGLEKNKESAVFPLESVICIKSYKPSSSNSGLGAEEVLADELDIWAASSAGLKSDLSAADGGAWIIYPKKIDQEKAQAELDDVAADEARYKALGGAPTVVPNNVSPKDKRYVETRDSTRDVILARLGVPRVVVFPGDATYENLATAGKQLWKGPLGVISTARVFQDALTELQRRLEIGKKLTTILFPWFSTADIAEAQDDPADKIAKAAEIAARGVGISFNEAIGALGVEIQTNVNWDRRFAKGDLSEIVAVDPDADEPEQAPVSLGPLQAAEAVKIVLLIKSGNLSPEAGQQAMETFFGLDPNKVQELIDAIDVDPEPEVIEVEEDDADRQYAKSDLVKPDVVLKRKMVSWIRGHERAQIAKLRKFAKAKRDGGSVVTRDYLPDEEDWDLLLVTKTKWAAQLAAVSQPSLSRIFKGAILEAAGEHNSGPIKITDPRVHAALLAQTQQLAGDVSRSTEDAVKKVIARALAGVDEGKPLQVAIAEVLPDLTADLKQIYGHKERRGATIARTETGKAQNTARFLQYEEIGVTHLEWRISPTGDNRPEHSDAQGEIVPFGERFSNGMKHPHEQGAPAAAVINCRCRVIGHFQDEDDEE